MKLLLESILDRISSANSLGVNSGNYECRELKKCLVCVGHESVREVFVKISILSRLPCSVRLSV